MRSERGVRRGLVRVQGGGRHERVLLPCPGRRVLDRPARRWRGGQRRRHRPHRTRDLRRGGLSRRQAAHVPRRGAGDAGQLQLVHRHAHPPHQQRRRAADDERGHGALATARGRLLAARGRQRAGAAAVGLGRGRADRVLGVRRRHHRGDEGRGLGGRDRGQRWRDRALRADVDRRQRRSVPGRRRDQRARGQRLRGDRAHHADPARDPEAGRAPAGRRGQRDDGREHRERQLPDDGDIGGRPRLVAGARAQQGAGAGPAAARGQRCGRHDPGDRARQRAGRYQPGRRVPRGGPAAEHRDRRGRAHHVRGARVDARVPRRPAGKRDPRRPTAGRGERPGLHRRRHAPEQRGPRGAHGRRSGPLRRRGGEPGVGDAGPLELHGRLHPGRRCGDAAGYSRGRDRQPRVRGGRVRRLLAVGGLAAGGSRGSGARRDQRARPRRGAAIGRRGRGLRCGAGHRGVRAAGCTCELWVGWRWVERWRWRRRLRCDSARGRPAGRPHPCLGGRLWPGAQAVLGGARLDRRVVGTQARPCTARQRVQVLDQRARDGADRHRPGERRPPLRAPVREAVPRAAPPPREALHALHTRRRVGPRGGPGSEPPPVQRPHRPSGAQARSLPGDDHDDRHRRERVDAEHGVVPDRAAVGARAQLGRSWRSVPAAALPRPRELRRLWGAFERRWRATGAIGDVRPLGPYMTPNVEHLGPARGCSTFGLAYDPKVDAGRYGAAFA